MKRIENNIAIFIAFSGGATIGFFTFLTILSIT